MKRFIVLVCLLLNTAAFGKDGVSTALETNSGYRYIGGTRQEGILDAGLGLVRRDRDYGLHLSLGPVLYSDDYSKLTITYGAGGQVRGQGAAMYHEAAFNVQWWVVGFSMGHAWEHKANLNCPQGSGLGKRNFGRLSITIEGK